MFLLQERGINASALFEGNTGFHGQIQTLDDVFHTTDPSQPFTFNSASGVISASTAASILAGPNFLVLLVLDGDIANTVSVSPGAQMPLADFSADLRVDSADLRWLLFNTGLGGGANNVNF